MSSLLTRRQLLTGIAGVAGLAGTAGVVALTGARDVPRLVAPGAEAVARAELLRRRPGAATVAATLTPRPVTIDLGGVTVATWGYDEAAPGPVIRARAGDLLRVDVVNQLPADTSVHWHGVALRNDMDGVPNLTQKPITAGAQHTYEFTAPDPGTYFYHPHSGVQLDRALYGVLIVDDPTDAGRYDQEWIVVLDDWIDGTGRTPDDVLASFGSMSGMHGDMAGMHHGSGERVRLQLVNKTTMFHPMHVHGHTFGLTDGGPRKDTVIVKPDQTVTIELDATNPGQWMTHCHNIYHAETGMMINLAYQA